MSLRSAVALLFVVAVFVVAQWSDLIMITYYNATPVKMCSLDKPDYCVYVIKLNFTSYSPNTTSIFLMYQIRGYSAPWEYGGSLPDTALLQALYYYNQQQQGPLTITVPAGGYLYGGNTFYVDGRSSDALTVCGKSYSYIAPVSKGTHTLTKFYPNIYFLDPATCVSYLLVGLSWSSVKNITTPWALVYIMHMPTGRRVLGPSLINGTRHIYSANIALSDDFWPVGRGVYVGNGTYLPTIATTSGGAYASDYWLWYGPVPYENYSKLMKTSQAVWFYTIGADLSDGVTYIRQPAAVVDFSYVSSDGAAGYLRFDSVYSYKASARRIIAYMRRYSVVEVTMTDKQGYVYGARTIACPEYPTSSNYYSPPDIMPFRLDVAKQLELCNNSTKTLYVALYVNSMYYYNFIDQLEPGRCRMMWFDGTKPSSDIIYYFYNSSATLCLKGLQGALFSVQGLAPWYRYYVFGNNTVRQGPSILPDTDYYSAWLNITKWLAQQYNATLNTLLNLLKQQQYNATQALQSFIASQPHLTGTIKVDSATSTWLRTTLNQLQKWRAVGSSASFGVVTLPAVPTAVAPVAAAAVAVAWAASRRDDDVVTTAAIAGIALAIFGLLMTLIYGPTSLPLVALGIITAAAAAAWRRI
jgi:hypothetical protein